MIAYDKLGTPGTGGHAPQTGPRAAALAFRDLRIPHGWCVEARSPRQGTVAPTAVPPNRMALHVELGSGTRGPLHVGRSLPGPLPAQAVCLRCYALTAGDAPLFLGLALTTAQGTPWLARAPVPVPLQRKITVSFDLRGLVPAAESEIDRIVVGISTTARTGFVVIERVVLW